MKVFQVRAQSFRRFSTSAIARVQKLAVTSSRQIAPIDIHPEVQDALSAQKPIVALETALVTHGLPYPQNLETELSLEKTVRSTGSIPATIAVLGGRIKIGLERSQLEHLADTANNPTAVKLSRRDIGPAIALNRDGGTTISATLIFAALVGIKVFGTGGLGGVHRGGESSLDVSADLFELSRCPVGVCTGGIKSILDVGRTLEYLETLGVPVLSFAKTNDFPNFFSPHSGFMTPWHSDDPAMVARLLRAQGQLGMTNGALIGVPVPAKYESVGAEIQKAVDQAVIESQQNGISKRGKDVTPWLLNRVSELTQGKSIESNIALLEETALVAGRIAVEYAKLRYDSE